MFKINSLCAIVALLAAPLVAAQDLPETDEVVADSPQDAVSLFEDPPAEEAEAAGELLDSVAAIVNEGIVLRSEYLETLELITTQSEREGWPLPPDDVLEEQVLERVIQNEIQLQRAEMIGLQVSDQMLNQVIASSITRVVAGA